MAEGLTKNLSIRITVIADIAKDLVGASDAIRFALKKPIQEATKQLESLKTAMSSMSMKTVGTAKTTATAARATTRDLSSASSTVMDKLTGRVQKLTDTVKKLRDELKAVKAEARSVVTGGTTGATTGGVIGPTSRINEPLFQESKRIQENINLQSKLNSLMRSSGVTRGSEFGIISNLAGIEGNVKKLETVLNKARALMQRGFTAKELGFGSTAEMEKQFKSAEKIIGQYGAKIRQITSEQAKATWLPGTQTGKSASESAKVFNQIEKERTAEMSKQAKFRAQEASSIKQQLALYKQLQSVISHPNFDPKEFQRLISMMQSGGTLKGNVPYWAQGIDANFIKNLNQLKTTAPAAYDAIAASAQKAGVNIGQQYGAVQKYANSIRNFMKFQMEWFAGAGLIFGAIAALRRLISAGIDFEQTMHDVAAVTGLGYNELERFSAVAIETSKNSPLAATEVAKLGLQLLRAGLEADDATEAMRVASKVAVISGEDMKTVADTVATAMMAWKMSGTEAERVGNVIAIGMNKSRLTVQDLGTAFNYIAGVAKSLNITFEETNSVLAVLSNLGVRASTMATGWTQFMSSLIAPSKEFSTWLQRVGADMNKLDPTRIQGPHKMVTILNELKRIGFGTSEAFGMLQVRAGRFYQFLSTAGPEALLKMEAAMSDTKQLNEAYEKSMAGLKNTMKSTWNTLESGAVIAMQNFAPALRTITVLLKALMTTFAWLMRGLSSVPAQIILVSVAMGYLLAKIYMVRKEITALIAVSNLSGWGLIVKGIGALAVITGVGAMIDSQLSKADKSSTRIEGMGKYKDSIDKAKNSALGLAGGMDDVGDSTKSAFTAAQMFKEEWARVKEPDITNALKVWDEWDKKVKETTREFDKTNDSIGQAIDRVVALKAKFDEKPKEGGFLDKLSKFFDMFFNESYGVEEFFKTGPQAPSLSAFKGYQVSMEGISQDRTPWEKYEKGISGIDELKASLKRQNVVGGMEDQRLKATLSELRKSAEIKASLSEARTYADIERIAAGASKLLGDEAFQRQDLFREIAKAYEEVAKKKNKIDASAFSMMLKRQKEEIEAVKLAGQEKIEERAFEYEQAKLMDDEYFIKIESNLEREKASLEFYYSNGLILAEEYFNKKKSLNDKSIEDEIKKAKSAAWYKEESLKDQIKAQQDLYDATNKALIETTATPVHTEADIEKKKTALLDAQNDLAKITNTIKKLQDQKFLIAPELENQILKLAEGLKAFNEELERTARIVNATEGITKRQELLGIEKELLSVQIEANELAGNFGEAQKLKATMAGIEKDNALLTVRKQIVELETKRNEALGKGKDYAKNIDLQIYAYENLYEAVKKVKDEEERRKVAMTTGKGAFKLGFEDALNQWRDYNKQVYDMTKGTFEAMQQTFSTFFFDAMTGQLKTLRDYWRSFTSSVMQMLSQMVSRWLMLKALGWAAGIMHQGGLVMHSGGLVMHSGGLVPELPRYHDGFLAPDERPAILQTGERVLSRKQNREYEQGQKKQSPPVIVHMTVNAIDAKSFEGRIYESRKAVAGALMSAGADNHPMRRRR